MSRGHRWLRIDIGNDSNFRNTCKRFLLPRMTQCEASQLDAQELQLRRDAACTSGIKSWRVGTFLDVGSGTVAFAQFWIVDVDLRFDLFFDLFASHL